MNESSIQRTDDKMMFWLFLRLELLKIDLEFNILAIILSKKISCYLSRMNANRTDIVVNIIQAIFSSNL